VIAVVERTAVAAVPASDGYLLIDVEAVPFQSVVRPPAGLAIVRLDSPGPSDPTTRAALRVLAALTPQLRAKLAALVAESPVRIQLDLTDGRKVVWGDAQDSATKARVATALLSQAGRTIDVSAPEVATVRP
jgi:cell division protein FtsQ